MDRFNLNLFFALDAILHSATITQAAKRVHLSQPAMSASLKKLRGYFRDELVVYENGEMRLTALATALRPRIRAVLQSSREALNLSLDFDPATDRREIRLCAAYVLEITLLSRLIAGIVRAAPFVDVMSVPFHYQPIDALLRENVDLAIVSEAFTHPAYPRQHVMRDTVCSLVWSGSEAFGETMTEREYFDARHATMFDSSGLPDQIGSELEAAHASRRINVGVSHYSALPQAIVGTDLVVTTMTSFAELCARTMPVRAIPVPLEIPAMDFFAQWQPYRSDEPIIAWLLEQVSAAATSVNLPAS